MKLISKRLFTEQPDENTGVLSMAAYCSTEGDIMKYSTYTGSSDAFRDSTMQFSTDGGRTYSKPVSDRTRWMTEEGMMTRYFKLTALDKRTGRFYMFHNRGLLPGDRPEEGLMNWQIYYSMSEDGGRTFEFEEPVVLSGPGYDEFHPIRDVVRGRNSFMVGDWPCEPYLGDDGSILMAVQCTLVDEEGRIYNPGGGYTYQYSVLLHGRFAADGRISWDGISDRVEGDPARSTRGAIEPSVMKIPDGRVLMVMRGSNGGTNDPYHRIPGYRWYSVSEDGGYTFTEPEPWKYTDGSAFFSPSSCSMILRHSSGRFFWIGNICSANSRANMPRNPLVIAGIDKDTLLLERESRYDFIKRQPDQYRDVTFSNFYAREERDSGDILVYCTAMWQSPSNVYLNSSSYEYRLRP